MRRTDFTYIQAKWSCVKCRDWFKGFSDSKLCKIVCFHPSVSLNNEKYFCDKTAVCEWQAVFEFELK